MGMLIVIFCAIALLSTAKSQTEDDFLSKLTGRVQFGIKLASQLFGFDPSKSLLNSLSFTLQKLGKNGGDRGLKGEGDRVPGKENLLLRDGLLSVVIRSFGLNNSQINSVAVNIVIFIVKMITQAFNATEKAERKLENSGSFSPLQLMMSQSQVIRLMAFVQDPLIVDRLLAEMNSQLENYAPKDVECIKLLVCKTTPFVWGMQKSLKFFMKKEKKETEKSLKGDDGTIDINDTYERKKDFAFTYEKLAAMQKENKTESKTNRSDVDDPWILEKFAWDSADPMQRMYMFLPTLQEVIKYGDTCEERYPSCLY